MEEDLTSLAKEYDMVILRDSKIKSGDIIFSLKHHIVIIGKSITHDNFVELLRNLTLKSD